jgi:uncharacterized protein (TIGR00255 family)
LACIKEPFGSFIFVVKFNKKGAIIMIYSMTGYGRGEVSGCGKSISVEIKSINHRFLEMSVKYPRYYSYLEEKVKGYVKKRIERGRVDVYINIENIDSSSKNVKVDKDLAVSYHNVLSDLAKTLNMENNLNLYNIINLPDVLKIEEQEEDAEKLSELVLEALDVACDNLIMMRTTEGNHLIKDINKRQSYILEIIDYIESRTKFVVEEYKTKLEQRVLELSKDIQLDENRLMIEIAIFADKSNITEEVVRLKSHLSQLEKTISQGGSIGRTLDFMIQEMNREINTIGSKANDYEISQNVVIIKSELEKIREQIQNLE